MDLHLEYVYTEVLVLAEEGGVAERLVEVREGGSVYRVHPESRRILSESSAGRRELLRTPGARARYLGRRRVAGFDCGEYEAARGRTVCLWNGVALRETDERSVLEATRVSVNPEEGPPLGSVSTFDRIRPESGDTRDLCRVEDEAGRVLARLARLTPQGCLDDLCEPRGTASARRGIRAVCVYDEHRIREYRALKRRPEGAS